MLPLIFKRKGENMVSVNQIQAGVVKYVDEEIIPKASGIEKWLIGVYVSLASKKSGEIVTKMKDMPVIKMLGVIDDNGMVDIDTLYEELLNQAKSKGSVSINMPVVGVVTLNYTDVEKLYQCILASDVF